jgi:CheY-like chemotaxis protein
MAGPNGPLRVLLVEDEPLVAMLLQDMIEELGGTVAGAFPRLAPALDFARTQAGAFDVAILDMNLGGERSEPLAEHLDAAGAPFIFSTGYGGGAERWPNAPVLAKPYEISQLQDALNAVLAR